MKSEYFFTLAVILLILFSISAVVASDNTTSDDACLAIDSKGSPNEDSVLEIDENQNALNDASSIDEVDLSVWVDVENVYVGNDFNQVGSVVPWNVTVTADNGIAHNTKVYITFSDNMEFVSHNETMGTYDSATGIWNLGDLTSSDSPLLLISTKLKENGKFSFAANATTTSKDTDLSNNYIPVPLKSGSGKTTSNTTETTDTKGEVQHNDHQFSDGGYGGDVRQNVSTSQDTSKGGSQDTKTSVGENKKSDVASTDSQSKSDGNEKSDVASNSKTKSVSKSSVNVVSKAFEYLGSSIGSIFNPVSEPKESDLNSNPSAENVEALFAYDYTKIPLIIFSAFLMILIGLTGYDKIKSY